jgi:hypothetical protein
MPRISDIPSKELARTAQREVRSIEPDVSTAYLDLIQLQLSLQTTRTAQVVAIENAAIARRRTEEEIRRRQRVMKRKKRKAKKR